MAKKPTAEDIIGKWSVEQLAAIERAMPLAEAEVIKGHKR